jgi:two-component system, cell cycle response regulator DivK
MSRALIIEDDDNNMELISFILEANGYELIKAETGNEGYESALKNKPDFIVLDIQLPDIDGFEVLKKIRTNTETQDIPVIAMTSYAMAGGREKMLAAGCNGYVEKPIDPDQVVSQIKRAIGEAI